MAVQSFSAFFKYVEIHEVRQPTPPPILPPVHKGGGRPGKFWPSVLKNHVYTDKR
jgi:hypothetical protein